MQLQVPLILASLALTNAAAPEPMARRDAAIELPAELSERAGCVANCKCHPGIKTGIYCGNCDVRKDQQAIDQNKIWDHAYQCGSGGSCCDYGYASDCGTKRARCASGFPSPLT